MCGEYCEAAYRVIYIAMKVTVTGFMIIKHAGKFFFSFRRGVFSGPKLK